MSSFICDPKHFNSIEHKMFLMLYKSDFYCPYLLKDICPKWYDKRNYLQEQIEEEVFKHIDTLRELNVLCVSLQYKHHYEGVLDKEIEEQTTYVKTKTEVKELTNLGFLNALYCLNYQIETEHLTELRDLTIEESNAMKFLQELIHLMQETIINSLPEDKTNTWEIN